MAWPLWASVVPSAKRSPCWYPLRVAVLPHLLCGGWKSAGLSLPSDGMLTCEVSPFLASWCSGLPPGEGVGELKVTETCHPWAAQSRPLFTQGRLARSDLPAPGTPTLLSSWGLNFSPQWVRKGIARHASFSNFWK